MSYESVTLASVPKPALCKVCSAETSRTAGETVSRRRPRLRASSATLSNRARPMPRPRIDPVTTTGSTSPARPSSMSPMNPTTPSSLWSATHMPERFSWVRYSSNPAPGSRSDGAGSPYRRVRCSVSSPQSARQALWSEGRYARIVTPVSGRVSVSVIGSCLLSRQPARQPNRVSRLGGVDLAYLREHPQQLPTFLKHQRIRETPVPGGSICQASRLTLEDGASVFTKTAAAPPDFFATEAEGLRWLREAGAVPVPEVIAVLDDLLVLEWVDEGPPSREAA